MHAMGKLHAVHRAWHADVGEQHAYRSCGAIERGQGGIGVSGLDYVESGVGQSFGGNHPDERFILCNQNNFGL